MTKDVLIKTFGPSLRFINASLIACSILFYGHLSAASGLDEKLREQYKTSFTKLLANISPADAHKGVVIASPSRHEPDYYFHWVRDAALVMEIAVQQYRLADENQKIFWWRMMHHYIDFSRRNQLANALTGLGEPKFHVDGVPYAGPWGRPQNDGPALRALTLTRFARLLLERGEISYVRGKLYNSELPAVTVIKADLEFVAHHWREKNFCLWEEVKGDHFYTRIAQLAALKEGAELARKLNDFGAAFFYDNQAELIRESLRHFWDPQRGLIRATLNRVEGVEYKMSDLDTAVILGVLHAGLPPGGFSVDDPRVLATAERLDEAFRREYKINQTKVDAGTGGKIGTAIGRYPEDRYSGGPSWEGNPWVLTTAALAELHYKLADYLADQNTDVRHFEVNSTNYRFLRKVSGPNLVGHRIQVGMTLVRGSGEMAQLIQDLNRKGDAYMRRIIYHANPDGSLAEQIDRNSGYMVSARDLTWSYAAFITAFGAR